jgi:hypothetical protein
MTNKRLVAGFSGVMALLMTCGACTSIRDLSSYSAGSKGAAGAPGLQAPIADGGDATTPTPQPEAGAPATLEAEAQTPSDVPLIPPDTVAAVDDCTGPDEFTDPDATICYRLDDRSGSWSDARDLCQAWGGDLAKVETVAENTALGEHCDQDVWLGASDVDEEGSFRWIDGSGVDAQGAWAPTQPDDYDDREDCLELRAMDDRWNDVPCMGPKVALCERSLRAAAAE